MRRRPRPPNSATAAKAMTGGAAELCTGERAVVLLFILRVLISVPLSLFFEASALCFLALAALLLEFATDSPSSPLLHKFKIRPGASSGLLLGTVTFPTVTLSQLIQLSRELSGDLIGADEVANLSSQYWAASASCFGVVIFFCLVLYWPFQSTQTPVYAILHIALYGAACYLSLVTVVDSGWIVAVQLIWLVCHSLATIMLIQYILHTFPACASIGEALLVSCGVVVYFGNALAHTLSKFSMTFLSTKVNFVGYGPQSELATVIQGVMLGLLLLPVLYKGSLRGWHCLQSCMKAGAAGTYGKIGSSILFYLSLVVMLTILVPAWLHFAQDFSVHPVSWVFMFVFTEPFGRLTLCLYWILVILVSVFRFYNISKHSKIERILLRKYYHLVAVLVFSPAILFQPTFLDLAYGAALVVFLVLEMIRIWKIWPLGDKVHLFMNAFTDHRDSEILIISHFSLLLGCALPKWLSSGFNDRPLAPFAGILSLGIGDTMASVVGHKYGVIRWSKTGKKTLEGTAAGITSVLAACLLLVPLITSTGFVLSKHWLSLIIAVTISGLLEAYTAQLDNAFIPLVFYSLLCL